MYDRPLLDNHNNPNEPSSRNGQRRSNQKASSSSHDFPWLLNHKLFVQFRQSWTSENEQVYNMLFQAKVYSEKENEIVCMLRAKIE